jgi:hypothetical protein
MAREGGINDTRHADGLLHIKPLDRRGRALFMRP